MPSRKPTKAEQIARIPDIEISRLKGEEGRKQLAKYVRTMAAGYKRRVNAFNRRGLVSHAQIAFEKSYPRNRSLQLTEMSLKQLHFEFARYAKFFNDQTSTVEGINEVNAEQDRRIFGADKRGRPLQRMTAEQRENYWDLYDEYLNQNPGAEMAYSSEFIQQYIGEAMFSPRFTSNSLTQKLEEIRAGLSKQKAEIELQRSVPNVYMGRGPFTSK